MRWLFLVSAPLLWCIGVQAAWPPGEVAPFGLIVGHNDGGPDMERLRYAHRDAEKMRDVFVELGRLHPARLRTVLGEDVDAVRLAMAELDRGIQRAKQAGQATLLLVYYSGHAKDGQLRLGTSRLATQDLKQWLTDSPADIRVAFIDACQSGEITRLKGGALAPSMVEMEHTRGHIIITSSSAEEGSQESDEIGGSFFTHYLVSGLRGDADRSADATVSLREIYEYAYNRTVDRTASTRGGIQHPTYGYRLAGRGEIILTRTAALNSGFEFGAELNGEYLVYDLDKQRIAAELHKRIGQERFIAVPPGRYAVKKRRSADLLLGQARVRPGQRWRVDDAELHAVAFENDTTKGLVAVGERAWQIGYSLRFGGEAFFDAPTRDDLFYTSGQLGLQVEFLDLLARNLSLAVDVMLAGGEDATRVELDGGISQTVAADFLRLQFGVGLYYHLRWSRFGLYAGPRLTLLIASRSFGEPLESYPTQSFGSLSPGLAAGAVLRFSSWDLFLEGRVHYLYYNLTEDASLGFGGVYLGIAYRH